MNACKGSGDEPTVHQRSVPVVRPSVMVNLNGGTTGSGFLSSIEYLMMTVLLMPEGSLSAVVLDDDPSPFRERAPNGREEEKTRE